MVHRTKVSHFDARRPNLSLPGATDGLFAYPSGAANENSAKIRARQISVVEPQRGQRSNQSCYLGTLQYGAWAEKAWNQKLAQYRELHTSG